MRSNYKRLGDYIRQIDIRNKDDERYDLLGVSVEKCFISSIANTVGTDWHNYKIIKKGQFCYIPDTSRRGDKIGIAHLTDREIGLVSAVYTVFEVWNEELVPEYLMLWFKRPEFDRYARFHSHGSVREIFDWEEMCNVELPIPPIEEQKAIVNAYETIERRIALKRKINDNLEATGISILTHIVGTKDLIVDCDMLEIKQSLPAGWDIVTIKDFCVDVKSGATPSRANQAYWTNGTIPWLKSGEVHNNVVTSTEEHITELGLSESSTKFLPKGTVLMAMYGVTAGQVAYLAMKATTNQAICGMICKNSTEAAYLFFTLLANQVSISRQATGGAQSNLSKEFIENIPIIIPNNETINSVGLLPILLQIEQNSRELEELTGLSSVILKQLSRR